MAVRDDHPGSARVRLLRWAGTPGGENTLATAFLLALTLAVFGSALFGPGDMVLSNIDADLAKQFVHWRAFGFRELRAGHLALWNPHIYAGAPYFGGFQSALLYPPNWLYLCLPLARAINVGIALHFFLAGWFMFLWTRHRALHPLACLLAAVLFMFSGVYFPHVYAGHLPNLCTMVWAPLVFLSIDGWLERRAGGWLLLGAGVIALQILAGHPQYVFYTGVAASLYCLLCLWRSPRPVQATAGLGVMCVGAVALSAVQLLEGLHAAGESARSIGTSMSFAALFSFPPENFLTFIVPGLFGNMTGYDYWGRCYLWEMSVFFGVSGLVLAVYGACCGERSKRQFCAVIAVVMMVLALGGNSPFFEWLYRYAPGFDKFRGWSKFTFPATLFLVMLAAVGFDRMLRHGLAGHRVAVATLAGGLILLAGAGAAGVVVHWSGPADPSPLHGPMRSIADTGEQLLPLEYVDTLPFLRGALKFAAWQLFTAATTTLALGVTFLVARKRPRVLGGVFVIALVEMLIFAGSWRDTFPLDDALDTPAARFLHANPVGDDRVLNRNNSNLAMSIGARDLGGYDPGMMLRYAEWLASTQCADPDDFAGAFEFRVVPSTLATLLRCRYILKAGPDEFGEKQFEANPVQAPEVAPRLRLITQVRVLHGRADILTAMQDFSFDPAHTVILETPPNPPPAPASTPGTARVVAETSDSLTVEANLPGAAVLLVTDTYCSGWRAKSLLETPPSVQSAYAVQPGDYFLQAIPLSAGHHLLRLEYLPRAFVVGKWITLASLCVYAGLIGYGSRRRRQRDGTNREAARP